ncbi:DUF58 domain-containing protein [Kurthia senegalensis]|uniref:DUF58 domain-containing protein n=1 Tax=Kurthia senegalensis TaxID=1033740 RepID=UPI000287DAD8|nr:DUF58 domain-containing protein [Kurthia senegalensis]
MNKWIWTIVTVLLISMTVWEPTSFSVLLLGIWLLWNVVASLLARFVTRQWNVHIDVTERALKGSAHELKLTVTQRAKWPIFQGVLDIRAEHVLSGAVMNEHIPFSLGANDAMTISLPIDTTYCGAWRFETAGIRVATGFPFYVKRYAVQKEATMLIWPKPFAMELLSPSSADDLSAVTLRQKVTTNETNERLGLRPYRMGDSMKQIHWKLSAKQDELVVEEQLEEEQAAVQLYVEKATNAAQYDTLLSVLFALLESCKQSATAAHVFVNERAYEATQLNDIAFQLLTGQQTEKPRGSYIALVANEQIHDSNATILQLRSAGEDFSTYEFTAENVQQKLARIVL